LSLRRPTLAILSHSEAFYTTRRLLEAAESAGLRAARIDPTRVTLAIGDNAPLWEDGSDLPVPDIIIPRVGAKLTTWGLALLRGLRAAGAWSPVSPDAVALAQDKLASSQALRAAGLPVLETVAVREETHIEAALGAIGQGPYVLKIPHGTQGKGVMGASDRPAARAILECLIGDGHTVLVQPWVTMDRPRDLRVFVLGGRAYAACWRHAAAGEFRCNVHLGGTTTPAELTSGIAELAEGAAQAIGLSLCGVDLLERDGRFVVLEINGSPGIEGLEEASGRDVACAMISSMEAEWRTC
jgi:ribosomal protein S6--L-glutamate ligase